MTDWCKDLHAMHAKYGFHETVAGFDEESLCALLDFRVKFLEEELRELKAAKGPEDVVDALIDLCVVAVGTLDLFGVDGQKAWHRVHSANMSKERGIKPGRPNPLGMPDLIKPPGWMAPGHGDNIGSLEKIFPLR